jgi:cell division protein FtsW (lipid II flippase)
MMLKMINYQNQNGLHEELLNNDKLARAACVRCHGTKCPLLTALFLFFLSAGLLFSKEDFGPSGCVRCHGNKVAFFSLSSLRWVTFLLEGVIVGFRNFAQS